MGDNYVLLLLVLSTRTLPQGETSLIHFDKGGKKKLSFLKPDQNDFKTELDQQPVASHFFCCCRRCGQEINMHIPNTSEFSSGKLYVSGGFLISYWLALLW